MLIFLYVYIIVFQVFCWFEAYMIFVDEYFNDIYYYIFILCLVPFCVSVIFFSLYFCNCNEPTEKKWS